MEAAALPALALTEATRATVPQDIDDGAFASLLAGVSQEPSEPETRPIKGTETTELSPESILALLLAPLQSQPEPAMDAPEPAAGSEPGAAAPGALAGDAAEAPARGPALNASLAGQEAAAVAGSPVGENSKPAAAENKPESKKAARGQDGRAPAPNEQPHAASVTSAPSPTSGRDGAPRVEAAQQREAGPGTDGAAQPAAAEAQGDAPAPDPAIAQGVSGPNASGGRADGAVAQAARPPMPVHVAQQIAQRFDGKSTTIEIQLEAPEIGRVEVRLDVDAQQRVHASIAADHPATLSELVRSARDIERTLQSSGLDLSPDGISFDLAERGGREDSQRTQQETFTRRNTTASADAEAGEAPPPRPFGLETWSAARIDMWA